MKIREPLSGVEVQPVTEKWLVLDPVSSLSPPEKEKERVSRFLSWFIEDSGGFFLFWILSFNFGGITLYRQVMDKRRDSTGIYIHPRSHLDALPLKKCTEPLEFSQIWLPLSSLSLLFSQSMKKR